ncbi:MAG: [FeFe] hydrogenase H-cluster radical SAM maturase HydE [Oscillospiraceae bacterium]|nr:[FeFe] hydrogenase H-cluster radical SAM maturase HydE [Oscillospiraceae bacterium]
MRDLVDKLAQQRVLGREEFKALMGCDDDYLFARAREARQGAYGKQVFMRGLIEFTNYCKNNCYYCGLRVGNARAKRFRMGLAQILDCCQTGYRAGFRTFVLQGGEDPYFTDEILAPIVAEIRQTYPDCAITLSLGERSFASYQRLFGAGADRYLLRHETAHAAHYQRLHPRGMSLQNRKACLGHLKQIGYQVGCGFMVGSPGQTVSYLVDDLLFIHGLRPQMVGIGPFLPHSDTVFAQEPAGDLRLTLNLLAILRLMRPDLLIPATTALGTLHPNGRELGVLAGANVVMPNLTPGDMRQKYRLYDHKISDGEAAAECVENMDRRMKAIGYELTVSRGDPICIA